MKPLEQQIKMLINRSLIIRALVIRTVVTKTLIMRSRIITRFKIQDGLLSNAQQLQQLLLAMKFLSLWLLQQCNIINCYEASYC